MKLSLSKPTKAGYYIEPAQNGNIYGWNIYCDDKIVANMTACDRDLAPQLDVAQKIVDSFNLADNLRKALAQ